MAKFTPEIQAAFDQTAREFNQILPDGIPTSFKTVSIVELGFAGNVLREIYRISLEDGSVLLLGESAPEELSFHGLTSPRKHSRPTG